jgi:hypothetical protein
MDTRLAKRRYRFGWRLFTGSVRWLRWPLIGWIALTPIFSAVFLSAIETGLWTISATVFQWFVAVTAGIWIHTNLPGTLARGVTRRELTVAYLVFGALASVATAAVITAGFAAEHALLALTAEPLDTWSGTLASGARYLLITPIYFFTGTLIGALTVRFAGRTWFTAAVLFASAGHYAGILALEFGFFGGGALLAWAAVAVAVTAVLITALTINLRSIPVAAKGA